MKNLLVIWESIRPLDETKVNDLFALLRHTWANNMPILQAIMNLLEIWANSAHENF